MRIGFASCQDLVLPGFSLVPPFDGVFVCNGGVMGTMVKINSVKKVLSNVYVFISVHTSLYIFIYGYTSLVFSIFILG